MSNTDNSQEFTGSCLCGACQYSITSSVLHFFQCHCIQCQKTTAAAFAANILLKPVKINWLAGETNMTRFDYPGRQFTQVFCSTCGSGMPFIDTSGNILFLPTGTLDSLPDIHPEANIFWEEHTPWLEQGQRAPKVDGFS